MRWWRLLGLMRATQRKDPRLDRLPDRVRGFVVYVLAQARLLRWPYAGVLHAMIFWGFVVLLTAIVQAIVEAVYQGFQFQRLPGSGAIAFLQVLFFFIVECGIVLALVNRLLVRPQRFRGSHRRDALLILAWIGGLLVFMELNYATRIAEGAPEALGQWRPVAAAIANVVKPLGANIQALPGVQHGQGAVTEDADHRHARPCVREPRRRLCEDDARRARGRGRVATHVDHGRSRPGRAA